MAENTNGTAFPIVKRTRRPLTMRSQELRAKYLEPFFAAKRKRRELREKELAEAARAPAAPKPAPDANMEGMPVLKPAPVKPVAKPKDDNAGTTKKAQGPHQGSQKAATGKRGQAVPKDRA